MASVWRKSRRSGSSGGDTSDCVELAALSASVGIRDSKNPAGGHLSVSRIEMGRFVERVKRGELDLR